jgi:hypothetical protein
MQGCNTARILDEWGEFEKLQEELERRDEQAHKRWAKHRWRRRIYHDLSLKETNP